MHTSFFTFENTLCNLASYSLLEQHVSFSIFTAKRFLGVRVLAHKSDQWINIYFWCSKSPCTWSNCLKFLPNIYTVRKGEIRLCMKLFYLKLHAFNFYVLPWCNCCIQCVHCLAIPCNVFCIISKPPQIRWHKSSNEGRRLAHLQCFFRKVRCSSTNIKVKFQPIDFSDLMPLLCEWANLKRSLPMGTISLYNLKAYT